MAEKPQRVRKPKHIFVSPEGEPLKMTLVKKHWRDTLVYHHGTQPTAKGTMTVVDVTAPLTPQGRLPLQTDLMDLSTPGTGTSETLRPGDQSPICAKCKLNEEGAQNPYLPPSGAVEPLITVVCDGISRGEDAKNLAGSDGVAGFMAKVFNEFSNKYGISLDRFRWSPLTRCGWRSNKKPNLKTKGNWCSIHLVQDLAAHPPSLIIPIGSVALGALCHKSNAQDWGGKLLTYRGWPDGWLTDPEFMLPRPDPRNEANTITGHPLMGEFKRHHIPMMPLQSPRIVFGSQNPKVIKAWKEHVERALKLAVDGVQPFNYLRPWYEITWDPNRVKERLQELIDNPGTVVSFDTETNGLLPWKEGSKIVFIMFRWADKDGNPQAIGFPWDYDAYEDCPESPLKPYLGELTPYVAEALMSSRLAGHNLTFDALWSVANIAGVDLDRIAQQCMWDTWHMAYTMKQQRGTLGLEAIAYVWCPDLAGYEEEMTLLIDLFEDKMHPKKGQHAHYANCPMELWKTHLEPYVMGDVEVVWNAKHGMEQKLAELPTYRMPLAHPEIRGKFRLFEPQSRKAVYEHIVSPASRMLIKLMGRGLHVDLEELARQEDNFPKLLIEAREKLRTSDPRILRWCEIQGVNDPDWEFDLDSTDQLRKLLFSSDGLNLPVEMLTEAGAAIYKDMAGMPDDEKLKYAKVDKFTLNKLSATNEQLRVLQDYRKLFKAYSSYIRPIRNYYSEAFDKKPRNKEQHLMRDGNVHAQFLLTGTRSGRLASVNPNLQQLPSGAIIKKIYTSRFGHDGCMYQGDLSQIELRLIAAACGDPSMVDAYLRNIDLHSLTMSRIFNLPYDHCIKDHVMKVQEAGHHDEAKKLELQRKVAKTINFLTGYGGGAYGLQATLANGSVYFAIEECEGFLEAFFDAYPSLRKYLSYYKQFIRNNGVAVSITGRVRVFEDVWSDNKEFVNKSLRAGCNHLIQATASDMMLICLCTIEGLMRADNMTSKLVSTVHDSLVIDALKEELPRVHEISQMVFHNIPEVMRLWFPPETDLSWMIVPFAGDCEVGKNYYDLNRLPDTNVDWDKVYRELAA